MLLSALVYFAFLVGNLQAQFPPNVVDTNYGKVNAWLVVVLNNSAKSNIFI